MTDAGPLPPAGASSGSLREALARESPGRHAIALAVVLLVAGLHLALIWRQGWIQQDEGLLAHMATRVLEGEVPHRDFDDVYTGGLEALHAGAMACFGERMVSLRIPLVLAALLATAAVYGVAARAAPPALAAAVALAAHAWGLPCYVASMPSWWITFLALGALLALLRHGEDRRRRWLVLAGLAAGLACLLKVVGLYVLAASILVLVHDEQREASRARRPGRAGLGLVLAFGGAFALAVVATVRARLGLMEAVHLVLPPVAVVAGLAVGEARRGGGDLRSRAAGLLSRLIPLLAGFVAPLALLVAVYARADALGALWNGVLVAPRQRLLFASSAFPPATTLLAALPAAALFASGWAPRPARLVPAAAAVGALALALAWLLVAGDTAGVYAWTFHALRAALPVVVVAASALLASPRGDALDERRRGGVLATSAFAAVLALGQYPFSSALYFLYVAPLLALAWQHLALADERAHRGTHAALGALAVAFAVGWVWTGEPRTTGVVYLRAPARARLDLPGCGLDVPAHQVEVMTELAREVQARTAPGDFIYAAPDCSEVFVLCGRRNPTRTMYDFFDPDFAAPARRATRILQALESHDVRVVVLAVPEFSPIDRALVAALAERYPRWRACGPRYLVRWRDP